VLLSEKFLWYGVLVLVQSDDSGVLIRKSGRVRIKKSGRVRLKKAGVYGVKLGLVGCKFPGFFN
jgi:hypothetical protein